MFRCLLSEEIDQHRATSMGCSLLTGLLRGVREHYHRCPVLRTVLSRKPALFFSHYVVGYDEIASVKEGGSWRAYDG